MPISEFNQKGKLSAGIHICSGIEFIDKFCSLPNRVKFVKPVSDILDFAMERNAIHLFVGGSFITSADSPRDLDCVMVFEKDRDIPSYTEKVSISGLRFDILYASIESRNLIDTYIKLFSSGRQGGESGIIQIDLYGEGQTWEIKHYPDDSALEIIKRVYNDRSLIDINEKQGILVSIHGLYSRAEWNMEIAPVASSQGWIFAPYVYDLTKGDVLFDAKQRGRIVDDFREWVYDIQTRYESNVSIIAHSFGTYIIGAYLNGFDDKEYPPVCFNSLILTGSILHKNFDWEKYRGLSVGSVYNMIAPNDQFIKHMPETSLKRLIGMSEIFGKSGVEGFSSKSSMLSQSRNEIFNHNNTIKRDIIETKWMPFLNAHRYSMDIETHEYIKRKKSMGI